MGESEIERILTGRAGEEEALNQRHLNPQLGRILRTIGFDRHWVEGEGAYLVDEGGDRYLDLLSGHGVFALGRNHPSIRAELERTLDARTANLPQLGLSLLPAVLAERLVERAPAGLEAVVLTSSGTEAVEAALKLARAKTRRARILYCAHGFHGLTLGALSVNGNEEFRERFGALLPGCVEVPFGDLDALRHELEAEDVAAFVVEPVQGKGVRIPAPDYLPEARELCRRHGALLIADEVQTGVGRTGRFLALEHWPTQPDLVTVSKALSGGYVPVGAVLATRPVFDSVFDSMENAVVHGSTFGGNDLAAAAGIATLAEIDRAGLVDRAAELGERLIELTRPLVERHETVREVRGLGLMWAIEFGPPAGRAARRLWDAIERRQPGLFAQLVVGPLFSEHRILTQVAGHRMNVVKALPPLVIDDSEIERFAAALEDVIAMAERYPTAMARFGAAVAGRSLRRRPRAAGSRATSQQA